MFSKVCGTAGYAGLLRGDERDGGCPLRQIGVEGNHRPRIKPADRQISRQSPSVMIPCGPPVSVIVVALFAAAEFGALSEAAQDIDVNQSTINHLPEQPPVSIKQVTFFNVKNHYFIYRVRIVT